MKIIQFHEGHESAKLRALRAKNVLTCQRVLRAYVLTCLAWLRAHVSTCYTCSRANMPTCFACLGAHVLTCLARLCTNVSKWLASARAHVPICLESLISNSLRDHVITHQNALPPQEVVLMPLFFSFTAIVAFFSFTAICTLKKRKYRWVSCQLLGRVSFLEFVTSVGGCI